MRLRQESADKKMEKKPVRPAANPFELKHSPCKIIESQKQVASY